MSAVNVLRNQVKCEQEKVARYRQALEWIILLSKLGITRREDIIEYAESALLDYVPLSLRSVGLKTAFYVEE